MGVDVADFGGADAGFGQGDAHGAGGAFAGDGRLGKVVGVGGGGVAPQFGQGFGVAAGGAFLAFQDENRRALAHYETVAGYVKGAAGQGRGFVQPR